MELSEKYAKRVYERRSFSAAAKELFVSQPALSATVARLEGELGFRIFDRSTTPLALTAEGKIYMEYLFEIAEREGEMERRIRNLSDSGSLAVGGSCYTAYGLLSGIAGEMKRRHPKVKLSVDMGGEGSFGNLLEKVRSGTLDMMLGYDGDDKEFERIPLFCEQLGVAMRRELVPSGAAEYAISAEEFISGNYSQGKLFLSAEIFSGVEFIRLGRHTSTEKIANEVLRGVKYSDLNVEHAHHTAMHYNLMREGLGAVLIADTHLRSADLLDPSIVYFVPKNEISKRTLYLIRRRGTEGNSAAECFKEIAISVASGLKQKRKKGDNI